MSDWPIGGFINRGCAELQVTDRTGRQRTDGTILAKNALKTYQDALDPCEPRIVVVCLPATVYGASSPRIRLDDTQEVTGSSPA